MITIDDPEIERLARELAARDGESVERFITKVVRAQAAASPLPEAGAPPAEVSPEEQARRHAILLDIQERIAKLPVLYTRSADEILGYDENGLPT